MQNNNLNPLPWYTNIQQQDWRKWYAYEQKYPLITPMDKLLPFQIKRERRTASIVSVKLYGQSGELCYDITADMLQSGLQVVPVQDFDMIINYDNSASTLSMTPGFYYAVLTDGVETWYSELFRVVKNIDKFIRVDYRGVDSLRDVAGNIVMYYDGGYTNTVYFDAQLGKPEYILEETSDDRDTVAFAEKLTAKKVYRFSTYAPECIADMMQGIFLADYVYVTADGITYQSTHFMSTPEWMDEGHYATIDNEFDTANVFKNIPLSVEVEKNTINISARILDPRATTGIPSALVELYTGERLMSRNYTDNNGTAERRFAINESAYNALTADVTYAVQMNNSEYLSTDSVLLLDGDQTCDVMFVMPVEDDVSSNFIVATLSNDVSLNRRKTISIEFNQTPNDILSVYVGGEVIAEIPDVVDTTIQIIIRKSVDRAIVDIYRAYSSRQTPEHFHFEHTFSDWITPSAVRINPLGKESAGRFRNEFIHIRQFDRLLTDSECEQLNNHGHPEMYTLAVGLDACVGNFIPKTLPTPINNPWPSNIGGGVLTNVGDNLATVTGSAAISWLISKSGYYDLYLSDSAAPSYADAKANGIDMGVGYLIPEDAIVVLPEMLVFDGAGETKTIVIDSELGGTYEPTIGRQPYDGFTINRTTNENPYIFTITANGNVSGYKRRRYAEIKIGNVSKYIYMEQNTIEPGEGRTITLNFDSNLPGVDGFSYGEVTYKDASETWQTANINDIQTSSGYVIICSTSEFLMTFAAFEDSTDLPYDSKSITIPASSDDNTLNVGLVCSTARPISTTLYNEETGNIITVTSGYVYYTDPYGNRQSALYNGSRLWATTEEFVIALTQVIDSNGIKYYDYEETVGAGDNEPVDIYIDLSVKPAYIEYQLKNVPVGTSLRGGTIILKNTTKNTTLWFTRTPTSTSNILSLSSGAIAGSFQHTVASTTQHGISVNPGTGAGVNMATFTRQANQDAVAVWNNTQWTFPTGSASNLYVITANNAATFYAGDSEYWGSDDIYVRIPN